MALDQFYDLFDVNDIFLYLDIINSTRIANPDFHIDDLGQELMEVNDFPCWYTGNIIKGCF